ncbi:MAG: tryptophan synthase subunit alpha [Kineosporiaceae bacterium]
MLDGPVIQQPANARWPAVPGPVRCWPTCSVVAGRISVPTVVMTYANLVVHRGAQRFCGQLADAGVAGLIVPDMPVDEVDELAAAALRAGIELVQLVAPSTAPHRCREICRRSRGFVYVVATMGTTGVREHPDPAAARVAARVREGHRAAGADRLRHLDAGQAVEAARSADGVVIASALMRRVLDGATLDDVAREVSAVRRALDHRRQDEMQPREPKSRESSGFDDRRRPGRAIRDGVHAPGEALPSQRELSAAYGVTLATLRQALQLLQDDGLVSQQAGRAALRRRTARCVPARQFCAAWRRTCRPGPAARHRDPGAGIRSSLRRTSRRSST